MNAPTTIPGAMTPAERILSRFDRNQLAGFIAVAIDLLDLADGDPDDEEAGDEHDVSVTEFRPGEPAYRLPDHRDPEAYVAGLSEDDEDDDPCEDDDPREEDDHSGGDPDDVGEPCAWVEKDQRQPDVFNPLGETDDDEPKHVPADMHGRG